MIPKGLRSASILLVTLTFFCEGKVGIPVPVGEGEPSAHLRRLQCKSYEGIVKFATKSSEATTTCKALARRVLKGASIAKKCGRELVDMDGFGSGAKVGDACPNACEYSCGNPGQNSRDGKWGETFEMKVIPIHTILLPDGNVLSYGTNDKGQQRADLYYEVWDPSKGTQPEAHKLLEHFTKADIFCSSLNVDPSTGNIIIMGGDTREPDGLGINTVLEFNSKNHEIRPHPKGNMRYARWYGTSVTLPNGKIFVIGGRSENPNQNQGSPIPELWSPNAGFRSLPGALIPAMAEVGKNHWWYPHVFVNSRGHIIVIMHENVDVFRVKVGGEGNLVKIGDKPFRVNIQTGSIMHRIDQVLMLDNDGGMWVVDISDKIPKWEKKNDLGSGRTNGCISMLPDGRVAITGGAKSTDDQGSVLDEAVYTIQIWDPTTNIVHEGPREKFARLYHSTSLIFPDGTVLSAGGGAPGPLTNLNGQLYSPDYLFDENQDAVATRPVILACPRNIQTGGSSFVMTVDDTSRVEKVTATKSGSNSHTRNCDTRWLDLEFTILNDNELQVFTEDKYVMIAGLWMLNTIDTIGTPSVASLVGINMAPLDDY